MLPFLLLADPCIETPVYRRLLVGINPILYESYGIQEPGVIFLTPEMFQQKLNQHQALEVPDPHLRRGVPVIPDMVGEQFHFP